MGRFQSRLVPRPPSPDDLMMPKTAADIIGVTSLTVRNYENRGILPVAFTTVEGVRMFRRSDVERVREMRAKLMEDPKKIRIELRAKRRKDAGKPRKSLLGLAGIDDHVDDDWAA